MRPQRAQIHGQFFPPARGFHTTGTYPFFQRDDHRLSYRSGSNPEADLRAEGAVPSMRRTKSRGKGSGADTKGRLCDPVGEKPQRAAYTQARP